MARELGGPRLQSLRDGVHVVGLHLIHRVADQYVRTVPRSPGPTGSNTTQLASVLLESIQERNDMVTKPT